VCSGCEFRVQTADGMGNSGPGIFSEAIAQRRPGSRVPAPSDALAGRVGGWRVAGSAGDCLHRRGSPARVVGVTRCEDGGGGYGNLPTSPDSTRLTASTTGTRPVCCRSQSAWTRRSSSPSQTFRCSVPLSVQSVSSASSQLPGSVTCRCKKQALVHLSSV
jgi:hypothetical protein